MNILSLAFLPTSTKPSKNSPYTLAILHQDYRSTLHICSRDISPDLDLSPEYSTRFPDVEVPDVYVERIVMIPPREQDDNSDDDDENDGQKERCGGLLVLGGRSVFFYPVKDKQPPRKSTRTKGKQKETPASKTKAKGKEKEDQKEKEDEVTPAVTDWLWSSVTAYVSLQAFICVDSLSINCRYALIDEDGSRVVVGDSFGRLVLVTIVPKASSSPKKDRDKGKEEIELQCFLIGNVRSFPLELPLLNDIRCIQASPPSTLTYITNHLLYLGSHTADHLLLHLSADIVDETSSSKENRNYFRVISRTQNIAPIMDAVVVGKDGGSVMEVCMRSLIRAGD